MRSISIVHSMHWAKFGYGHKGFRAFVGGKGLLEIWCRFNAYNQRSKVLGSQVTAAQNDAWIACNLLDEARKSYLQVLESFRDVLVNDWEGWFFPLADLTEFWKCANSMEADMKQWVMMISKGFHMFGSCTLHY